MEIFFLKIVQVPFEHRVNIFYGLVNTEFSQFQNQYRNNRLQYYRFTVRRERLYDDAFSEMSVHNFPGTLDSTALKQGNYFEIVGLRSLLFKVERSKVQ